MFYFISCQYSGYILELQTMRKKIGNFTKLAKIYRSYQTGRAVCHYLPLRIWLEPTDRCNLACPICINRTIPDDQKGDMPWELFCSIINQLEGEICDINLFHRGEPLLHPRISEMISYIKARKMTTRIHTNATKLTKQLSNNLLSAGLDYISFSFDGFDKETYERNRVNAVFEETLDNIINFLKNKKELKARNCFTVLQIIDTGFSRDQKAKQKFLKNFSGLPLNKISIRTPHNWAGGISVSHQGKPRRPIVCTFPWYGLTIFRDGKVYPCSQDYGGEIYIGDLNQQSLADIWNNQILQQIRKDFYHKNYGSYRPCTKCDRIWRTKLLGVPLEYIGTFIREAVIRK